MTNFEQETIKTCIELLEVDVVDSKHLVKITLQGLLNNNQFILDKQNNDYPKIDLK